MTTLANYEQAVRTYQAARVRNSYKDLAADPRYSGLISFLIEQIFESDQHQRLQNEARLLKQVVHVIPGVTAEDVERVMGMLEENQRLDSAVAAKLLEEQAPLPLDDASYEAAYRSATQAEQRQTQIDDLSKLLVGVHSLAKVPQLGTTLNQTRAMAPILGVQTMHAFLLKGYNAFGPIESVDELANTIKQRELAEMKRIMRQN